VLEFEAAVRLGITLSTRSEVVKSQFNGCPPRLHLVLGYPLSELIWSS
jgi:hypothetical protein